MVKFEKLSNGLHVKRLPNRHYKPTTKKSTHLDLASIKKHWHFSINCTEEDNI